MSIPFQGKINIDVQDSAPDWTPYEPPVAPSVPYVCLDDVGFSALEPYGGFIETPNIKRIADRSNGRKWKHCHGAAPSATSTPR
jgi:arylsulfatase